MGRPSAHKAPVTRPPVPRSVPPSPQPMLAPIPSSPLSAPTRMPAKPSKSKMATKPALPLPQPSSLTRPAPTTRVIGHRDVSAVHARPQQSMALRHHAKLGPPHQGMHGPSNTTPSAYGGSLYK